MNSRRKYIGRSIILIIWLFLISLPLFALTLAARQQITIGSEEDNHLRIFLLQEKDAEGIGIELARPFSADPFCIQTTVRYFMWTGEPEDTTFCQCFDPQTNDHLPAAIGVCSLP